MPFKMFLLQNKGLTSYYMWLMSAISIVVNVHNWMLNIWILVWEYLINIGSGTGLVPSQAIAWANVDPDRCHHVASLCNNILNESGFCKLLG